MSWQPVNRCLYRLASRLRPSRKRRTDLAPDRSGTREGILYLAWGRLGDAILAGPFTERLRELSPGPVVAVGRPETAAILGPQVDRFVPWDRAATADLGAPFAAVVTDLHAFHGGLGTLGALLTGVPAESRMTYEGYVTRETFVPHRPFPAGVSVVPSIPKPDGENDPERVHLWNDLVHYHGSLARELGAPEPDTGKLRPFLQIDGSDVRATLERFGLEQGTYWVCQPSSSIPKKDYPVSAWRAVLGAFPERRFVLLGTDREAERASELHADHVRDLAGATDVHKALALIAGAAGFLGPDSGLTHAAVALGVPTVCIAQNANLGWFFPYPESLGATHLRVVHHPDYVSCAGCFSLCAHEPLWTTYRRGALCLRTLPPDLVVEALQAPPARRPGSEPAVPAVQIRTR